VVTLVRRLLQRDSALSRRVRADRLTYLSGEKIARLEHFAESASKRVEGSIAEFGVAIGGSAIILATLAKIESAVFPRSGRF
jgi:O-methyltransferase